MHNPLEIEMGDGVRAVLKDYYQHGTYDGLIEGTPSVEVNRMIIDSAITAVKSNKVWVVERSGLLWRRDVPPALFVLEPRVNYVEQRTEAFVRSIGWLPRRLCVGRFESSAFKRRESSDLSQLVVIWFQEETAEVISPKILESFKTVPWAQLSQDFDVC